MNQKNELHQQIALWLLGSEDIGMSSEAIAARALGLPPKRNNYYGIPYDTYDFGRCYRMLKACPAVRIDCMRGASPVWDRLVEAWPQLTACYEAKPEDYRHFKPHIWAVLEQQAGVTPPD